MPSALPAGDPAPADGSLPASALTELGDEPVSLYLHVPFCAARCGYCDFNTYTSAELGSAPGSSVNFLDATQAELALAAGVLGERRVDTVFVGGGTPTLLAADELVGLLAAARQHFPLSDDAEVTTECNPESVDAGYLEKRWSPAASTGSRSACSRPVVTCCGCWSAATRPDASRMSSVGRVRPASARSAST